jgi:hypothetical protein
MPVDFRFLQYVPANKCKVGVFLEGRVMLKKQVTQLPLKQQMLGRYLLRRAEAIEA